MPVILRVRKLYEVVDLSRTEIRIRVDPTVAQALADYRNKHIALYEPGPSTTP